MEHSSQARFSTRGYVARKYALGVFVVVYALVAHWGARESPDREFFPVFNWSLFTRVYAEQSQPELHVISIGGTRFPEPVSYFELDPYFESARLRSVTVNKTLSRLRSAILRGDEAEVARLRKIIESRHLNGRGPVEYEIRSVVFKPVERWKDKNNIVSQTVHARFRSEGM